MKNITLSTENSSYLILELNKNQAVYYDFNYYIKTKKKIEQIQLITNFQNKKFDLMGKLDGDFNYSNIKDSSLNSTNKFSEFLKKEKICLDNSKNNYLFKAFTKIKCI